MLRIAKRLQTFGALEVAIQHTPHRGAVATGEATEGSLRLAEGSCFP